MATVVKMPQLGETVVEGTVARWLKAPGDPVDKFEPLLEITTDKIDTEIPSPAAGVLLTISAAEGETVAVGGVLAQIGEAGEVVAGGQETEDRGERAEGRGPLDGRTVGQSDSKLVEREIVARPSGRAFVSPVVARMAQEHAVDLDDVTGTGLGGRVTKKDMLAFVAARAQAAAGSGERETADVAPAHQRQHSELTPISADETVQPLSAMRRAIAQHMVLSKATSPHVTSLYEVDATAIVRHREANRQQFAAKGLTLTFTPYFVAAVAKGLRSVPMANSRFTEAGIAMNRRIHIGLAVALEDGLLVPVIRDADEKNLQGLARAVNEVAAAARSGTLAADAIKGGTFTITNHGVTGSLMGTPIIHQPQSGILGIGMIAKRAVVRSDTASLLPSADDAIVIRPICYLSFSFDHRILDGATADHFMAVVKESIETWPTAD